MQSRNPSARFTRDPGDSTLAIIGSRRQLENALVDREAPGLPLFEVPVICKQTVGCLKVRLGRGRPSMISGDLAGATRLNRVKTSVLVARVTRSQSRTAVQCAPPGVPVIIEHVVDEIDAIVKPVRGSRWQESQPGDREVRKQLRLVFKNNGLPPTGGLFDRAYAYIREHY